MRGSQQVNLHGLKHKLKTVFVLRLYLNSLRASSFRDGVYIMGRYDQNAKVYAKWVKEGRGQGQKENYKPWLYVYNVPSRGRSHRIWSYTSNRVVHCLSDLELSVFLLLEWSFVVDDIREQFPLDLQTTLSTARESVYI